MMKSTVVVMTFVQVTSRVLKSSNGYETFVDKPVAQTSVLRVLNRRSSTSMTDWFKERAICVAMQMCCSKLFGVYLNVS